MGLKDNKSLWAKRSKPDGPLTTPDLYAQVDREFSTQFIAERLGNKHETLRALRDKIGKKIDTALRTGKLVATDGKFLFGDLVGWVKTKPRLAHSVDGMLSIGHASASITAPSMRVSAFGYSLPESLDTCQVALRNAHLEINQLREENMTLRLTIAELTPFKAGVVEI
jgi:hypothetical protein